MVKKRITKLLRNILTHTARLVFPHIPIKDLPENTAQPPINNPSATPNKV